MQQNEKPAENQPTGGPSINSGSPRAESTGGYGQRGGWKKWLLVYVIVAIVIYGAIYYFFMRDTGSGTPTLGY